MKRALAVFLFLCMGCTLAFGDDFNFTPRRLENGKIVDGSPCSSMPYEQGPCAPFHAPSDRNQFAGACSLATTACLVHGLGANHAKTAIEAGVITSAYYREGPGGDYPRAADKQFGGGLAVYTRAVGVKHAAWPCSGYGGGSNEDKVQFVLHNCEKTQQSISSRKSQK